MDDYGTLQINQQDADEVYCHLHLAGTVTFPLAVDAGGAMIVVVCTRFYQIGVMPFGGNPQGRVWVGIYGRGCNHLSMGEIHPGYIEEKLGLHSSEAESFAKFWTMIWSVRGDKKTSNP